MYLIDSCLIRQLILDEAGARVRLENRRLPLGLRSLMHELQETIKDEDCIKEHDFEAAKQLLDHEMEVRTHIRIMKQSALTSEARGFSRRDVDMVTETDVSDVVSNGLVFLLQNYRIRISSIIKNGRLNSRTYYGQRHAVVSVSKAIRRARRVYEIRIDQLQVYIRSGVGKPN
jgi:ATP-dependent Clp protease ATP-binding subunit ClpA